MISPYFSRTTFSPVVNKPAVSAFRVPKGYGCSYLNRCLIFTKEDYWDTCCRFFDFMVPRRSPIPSGGLEIKLMATFKAVAPLADKMKVLLRAAYEYEFQAQKRGDDERDDPDEDNEDDYNLLEH